MSKFYRYAEQINAMAKKAFADYHKAEQALEKAKTKAEAYPPRHGMIQAEYQVKHLEAKAELLKAEEAMKQAKKDFESHVGEISAMRKDLERDIDDYYSIDPEKLDANTMELMKSGIMKVRDYRKIMAQAKAEHNNTMLRMIGKYAAEYAEEAEKEKRREKAQELWDISRTANYDTGNDTLKAFDSLSNLYSRTVENPGLISHWDELYSKIEEEF